MSDNHTDDDLLEATQGGTFPNGTSFAPGDVVPQSRIPPAERAHLRRRGVFVPVRPRPAESEPEDAAPKRAPAPANKRLRPGADKGAEGD